MAIDWLEELISRYSQAGVLVDTNLLLLYFVGTFDRGFIPQYKRTKDFAVEDFDLLVRVIRCFSCLVSTPNVLTEVDNLSTGLLEPKRTEYFNALSSEVAVIKEHYVPSSALGSPRELQSYGVADLAIAGAASGRHLVVTADFPLYGFLRKKGVDVVNFNHIRPGGWRELS